MLGTELHLHNVILSNQRKSIIYDPFKERQTIDADLPNWDIEILDKISKIISVMPFITLYLNKSPSLGEEKLLIITVPVSRFEIIGIPVNQIPERIQNVIRRKSAKQIHTELTDKFEHNKLSILETVLLILIELNIYFNRPIPLWVKYDPMFLYDLNSEIRKQYQTLGSKIDPPNAIPLIYQIQKLDYDY